jgi:hypothetical protein
MKRAWPLLAAGALFFVVALVWIGGGKSVARDAFDTDSSASTGPDGTSLAYRYLERQPGVRVRQLIRPLRPESVGSHAVVFQLAHWSFAPQPRVVEEDDETKPTPEPAKTKPEKAKSVPKVKIKRPRPILTVAEEEWVTGGGRLVVAVDGPIGELDVRDAPLAVAENVFPIWPGVPSITLPEKRVFSGAGAEFVTLYASRSDPVVLRQSMGSGELMLISVPEMFTNEHIANHLDLLLALVGDRRDVYFDETLHGLSGSDGIVAVMTDWNLGPLLMLVALAVMLIFWRSSSRLGPADDDDRDARSDAIDLVASLGALYGRSTTNGEAIALYHDALTRSVAAQSGLRGEALHRRVRDLTGCMAPPSRHEKLTSAAFHQQLDTINDAFRATEGKSGGSLHANHP